MKRIVLFGIGILLGLLCSTLHAQVPQLINYQGRVIVGTANFDGAGSFKFALVNAAGTTAYWTNDGTHLNGTEPTAAVTLTVAKGLYSVVLGDTSLSNMTAVPASVFNNSDVRLRVWFNDGTNGSQLLTPDQRLAAVGYAMMAGGVNLPATTSATAGVITQDGAPLIHSFGNLNFFAGAYAGNFAMTGSGNLGIGSFALVNNVVGNYNTALGNDTLVINTGSNNIAIGRGAGNGLTTGSNNIAIDNQGVSGESNIIRIGTSQTATYLTGIIHGDGSALTGITAVPVATPPGMALIPAGAFTMGRSSGDTDNDSIDPPTVTTVSAFYMDVNEVTLSQWQSVFYWAKDNGYTDLPAGSGKGPNHPVHTVSWSHAVKWCNARSERAGKTPVYYTDDAQTTIYKTGNVNVTNAQVKWTTNGYRLPTEAEWEKAARGGRTAQRFPWGNTITQNLANYSGNTTYSYDLGPDGYNATGSVGGTNPATSPVGSFASNGYGLNDMAGNVEEWCWDWYWSPYAGGTDPHGAATGIGDRILRGSDWGGSARDAKCAHRLPGLPTDAYNFIGFRAVLPLGQP